LRVAKARGSPAFFLCNPLGQGNVSSCVPSSPSCVGGEVGGWWVAESGGEDFPIVLALGGGRGGRPGRGGGGGRVLAVRGAGFGGGSGGAVGGVGRGDSTLADHGVDASDPGGARWGGVSGGVGGLLVRRGRAWGGIWVYWERGGGEAGGGAGGRGGGVWWGGGGCGVFWEVVRGMGG